MTSDVFYINQTFAPLMISGGLVNLSQATTLEIYFTKPGDIKGKWTTGITAVQELNDNNQMVWYAKKDFAANELNVVGTWAAQIRAIIGGKEAFGIEVSFVVKPIVGAAA